MKLDNVFKKTRIAVGRKNYITFTRRPEVPEGLLRKCNKCGGAIIAEDVKKDHYICPTVSYTHLTLPTILRV